MRSKKGEALTLSTVVIAVLVLVVLGVLLFIVYKYIFGAGTSIGELSNCNNIQDSLGCKTKEQCEQQDGNAFFKMGGCGKKTTSTDYCCIRKQE